MFLIIGKIAIVKPFAESHQDVYKRQGEEDGEDNESDKTFHMDSFMVCTIDLQSKLLIQK